MLFLGPCRYLPERQSDIIMAYEHAAVDHLLHRQLLGPHTVLYLIKPPVMGYGEIVSQCPRGPDTQDLVQI